MRSRVPPALDTSAPRWNDDSSSSNRPTGEARHDRPGKPTDSSGIPENLIQSPLATGSERSGIVTLDPPLPIAASPVIPDSICPRRSDPGIARIPSHGNLQIVPSGFQSNYGKNGTSWSATFWTQFRRHSSTVNPQAAAISLPDCGAGRIHPSPSPHFPTPLLISFIPCPVPTLLYCTLNPGAMVRRGGRAPTNQPKNRGPSPPQKS